MQTTTNYGLKIYEGTDLFNPLTVENMNTSDLDTIVKGVSNAAVGTATELLTGTVHALTRSDTARNVFHFTATANFEAGETFEVDGVQVTAKTPDGQNLSTGAYVINSSVLCILDGTLLTVIVNPAKALDADKLDGHDSTYFATAGDLSVLDNQVGVISNKVGTGVLDVGNDCVDGINTLNTHLNDKANNWTLIGSGSSATIPTTAKEVKVEIRYNAYSLVKTIEYINDDFASGQVFISGYYAANKGSNYCSVTVSADRLTCTFSNNYVDGQDVTTATGVRYYYR